MVSANEHRDALAEPLYAPSPHCIFRVVTCTLHVVSPKSRNFIMFAGARRPAASHTARINTLARHGFVAALTEITSGRDARAA